MIDFFHVMSVQEARARLFQAWQIPPFEIQQVSLADAAGRVLANDIVAKEDIPPYPRSTVDGFAVLAKDTFGASEALPSMLEIATEVFMGELVTKSLHSGQAARIPTGGALPTGCDACVMVEDTDLLDENTVLIRAPAYPGENIVHRGEDMLAGETVLGQGCVLRAPDVGGLAALGAASVPVARKPRVAILSTGDEIVPPEFSPAPGQIRDINSYTIAAAAARLGAVPVPLGITRDNYDEVRKHVEKGLREADIVMVSGGSSVGERDVTANVLDDLGPPGVLVHGVAVKPGKPIVLAICSGKPVMGLPGHPVSAMVGFDLFCKPVIRALTGAGGNEPESELSSLLGYENERFTRARLSRNLASAPGREDHIRVSLRQEGNTIWADPVLGKSGLIATMLKARGEIVIASEKEGLIAGSWVNVRLF